jgi:GAF domain-containing protein
MLTYSQITSAATPASRSLSASKYGNGNIPAIVYRTGRTTRMDNHSLERARGAGSAYLRKLGVRSTVGAPIVVAGRLWGVAGVASTQADQLAPDIEARIADFTCSSTWWCSTVACSATCPDPVLSVASLDMLIIPPVGTPENSLG